MSAAAGLREAPPRSWLFVPALRAPEWLPKARATGTDAIIVDLEDATAPEEKERAREVVRGLSLGGDSPWIFVRVNASPERLLAPDLEAAIASRAAGIVLPKVSGPEAIARVPDGVRAILVMIENARGVLRALEIADSDGRVAGLAFGGEDLSADLGTARTREPGEFATARSIVALAAAAAGVSAVDTPWLDIADPDGAGREARAARQLGFSGKLVIHPSHVGPVNAAFTPDERESDRARRIIEAFDAAVAAGSGIAKLDGRMIDLPVVIAARRVLAQAERGRRT
ncbi:MAG TPA: CoA ester lyase [Candidatus Limnocylindria bacterium]|nr:CoA ester lyase [Candidatus Limnocylindria bacterium]